MKYKLFFKLSFCVFYQIRINLFLIFKILWILIKQTKLVTLKLLKINKSIINKMLSWLRLTSKSQLCSDYIKILIAKEFYSFTDIIILLSI